MMNPLLIEHGLPAFERIRPQHIKPAIDAHIERSKKEIAALIKQKPTWSSIEAMELMAERIGRTWHPVSQLHSVMDHPDLRQAYQNALSKLTEYETEKGQNPHLFRIYQSVAETALNPIQRRLVDLALQSFQLFGVALPEKQKIRFMQIEQKLSELANRFAQNVLDASQAWQKPIKNPDELAGLPEWDRRLAKQRAEQNGQTGWLLNLDFPVYQSVIRYAENRALRHAIYRAYMTRASEQGPAKWNNSSIMTDILALRHEKARLLGYQNYAELSLATKMAQDTDQVISFLYELAEKAKPQAVQEYEALQAFAAEQGMTELSAWDIPFYSEKMRHQHYQLDPEAIKPYFPLPKVMQGLFDLSGHLFGIQIRAAKAETWHSSVQFFDLYDENGSLLGHFYFDLYARPHKQSGAWMADAYSRMHIGSHHQRPVAFVNCNFNSPVGDQPALLTHEEVQTLFHEFGHCLHHLLTEVDYPSIAGIAGVAWDAVELPSQLLENWCWQKDSLQQISAHYQTGQPLPDHLFQSLKAAKNFQSALRILRQIEFALFDFQIHLDEPKNRTIQSILDQVRQQIAVIKPPSWTRFAHSFSHIFAGGYAAGYYSYLWAEVLSADAFSLFEEQGVLNPQLGRSFRQNILARGGSAAAMDLFIAFRGRPPSIDPLLKQSGIG